jgi:hypothetical protein
MIMYHLEGIASGIGYCHTTPMLQALNTEQHLLLAHLLLMLQLVSKIEGKII